MSIPVIKLPFGLNLNGMLVHVADVENGKGCKCFCPACSSPLIAVQGKINQPHFRHMVDSECAGNPESAIHIAAKKMIVAKMSINLPECVSIEYEADSKGLKHEEREVIVVKGTTINFNSVEEEKTLGEMRVDLLAKKGETSLIIEILYRHKVDAHKIDKIRNACISAIEINLSNLALEDVKNLDAFWQYLSDPLNCIWLNNIRDNAIRQKLKERLSLKIQDIESKYKQSEIINKRQYLQGNNKTQMRIQQGNLQTPEPPSKEKLELSMALEQIKKYKNKDHIARLSREAKSHPAWQRLKCDHNLDLDELPDFLNVPVLDGDWIFGCDRRIWQAAIYYDFIIACKNDNDTFSIKAIDDWLESEAHCKVLRFTKAKGICDDDYSEQISTWNTLRIYLNHLCKLKMLVYTNHDPLYKGNLIYAVISSMPQFYTGSVLAEIPGAFAT